MRGTTIVLNSTGKASQMGRRLSGYFPQAETVYLIVWKGSKAIAMKFRVVSRTTAVVTLTDSKGNLRTVTARRDLDRYAETIPKAALAAFRDICRYACEDRSVVVEALRKAVVLARLIDRK